MIAKRTKLELQKKATTKNAIGERESTWKTVHVLHGVLDLLSGDSTQSHNAKLQDSSHIFLCDYVPLKLATSQLRALVNGSVFNVQLIDNPQELNYHLEIYLKYLGGGDHE